MRKVIMVLLTLFCSSNCIAQSQNLNDLHFNHMSIKDGLPEGVITTMLQDKEGYMWIGTQAGLVRYDGYTNKVYQFGIEDPLRSTISNIYEDRSGELWIGTVYEGLYHYDRTTDKFLHYKNNFEDANSISTGIILSMHANSKGNLWVLLADGFDSKANHINLFDAKKHQFKRYDVLEKSGRYTNPYGRINLFEDSKGHIWVGTNDGIYEYTPAGDKFILHFASANAEQQKTFGWPTEDAAHPGLIWMNVKNTKSGKPDGLLRYNTADNTVKTYHHNPLDVKSLQTDSVYTIFNDSQGRLLFGTENGLSVLDYSSEGFINYIIKDKKIRWYDNQVWTLTEDKSGNFWCGNQFNLFFFDAKIKTFSRYTPNEKEVDALPGNGYGPFLIDRAGNLWVGTVPLGLYWVNLKRSKFRIYKNNTGQAHYFPGGNSTSFAEEKDGTFWVLSSLGLYHWFPSSDSFALIKSLQGQLGADDNIWHLSTNLLDKKGSLWFGSFGNGLFNYNPETGRITNFKNNPKDSTSLSVNDVISLFEDSKAILWIGTGGGGLCSFNPETRKFKQYPHTVNNNNIQPDKYTLNDWVIYTIYGDKQGDLWLGTNNGGINRFSPQTGVFTSYPDQLSKFNVVAKIFEDSKQQLWVGTHISGLFLLDRKTNSFKKFGEKDGLFYEGVVGINEDASGNLWITSPRGISILNLQTYKVTSLGLANGLPEVSDFNNNFFKTREGKFLMPFSDGFISFDPEQLKPDTALPIVHIESVVFTKPQAKTNVQFDSVIYCYGKNEIKLKYNENRINFNYIGLQYQNSALNQYAYKLDGYDKDWIQAGTQQNVTYTNLSAGEYVFHVKGANSDGVWNPKEQVFTVSISPPWWRTWWAYVLYAIAIASLIWAFVGYRSHRLKKENKILEEKIAHRTEQLSQSIDNLKSTQSQLIQSEKMASLGELTAGIAHEIQNPLNFVNNFSDLNTELIGELQEEIKSGNLEEISAIAEDIKTNEQKINHHGKRADAIVKGMLQHSKTSTGDMQPTDINKLADEYLRLCYHGLRAKDKSFNATLQTNYDETIGSVNIISQDIGRVILNLINNAFYAVDEKKKLQGENLPAGLAYYEPSVSVSTKKINNTIEISIADNGNGIPQKIVDKIFQPFFTTKPTGQGTGLGLSLSHDIVKAHGGEIKVETKEREGTTFIIQLNV